MAEDTVFCQQTVFVIEHEGELFMKALWNGETIAESDNTIVIEGNHYFPPDSVNHDLLRKSATHTTCPWKGIASYYDVVADGKTNADAAWYYPEPKEAAKEFGGYIAFWRGVKVENS